MIIFFLEESKSKRVTLKQKHKVTRKVKEHHMKKAKEGQKLGLEQKAQGRERPRSMLYKLPSFDSVDDFLQKVATIRGKIPYYTMPATRNQEEPSEAKIVSELGKEFNIDEIYSSESFIYWEP
ncbi:hypothetical protein RHMOL_Rhmol09G0249200 [Rhododendron molle]|uniref:Uncharacterized protein n=1 Tax=Rhododendron molle TaxID=49168 RepID=A0ACC0MI54_RHOML|nr:hypothetical protein RHMOL_Rhmol09G0249200 [Rhododendron molle]